MKKSVILVVAIIIVILLVVFGFKNNNKSDDVIKIGVLAPLTGDFAVFGEKIVRGFEMAKEDLDFESNVEIIYEDACFPEDAVSATRKLINVDGIDILGASFCLIGLIPSMPILEEKNVIAFNLAANPDEALNHGLVFSTNISIKEDAEKIADYMFNNLGLKTVSVINYQNSFGENYQRYFSEAFTGLGGEVLSVSETEVTETDFRTELAKIKNVNPDAIFAVEISKFMGIFIKQAKELSIGSQIVTYHEAEDQVVIDTAGLNAEGLILSSLDPENESQKVSDFEKRYQEQYNELPDPVVTNAYDSFMIQMMVYDRCNGETNCMVKELEKISNYDGVSGRITINPDRSASKPTIFKIVKDGEFVKI